MATDEQRISNPFTEKRLYTVKEAARYLGLSVWGVRELYYHGKIAAVRNGRHMLLDRTDLDQWIERNKVKLNP